MYGGQTVPCDSDFLQIKTVYYQVTLKMHEKYFALWRENTYSTYIGTFLPTSSTQHYKTKLCKV